LATESYKAPEYHKTSPQLQEPDTAKLRHTKPQFRHPKIQKKSDFLPLFSFPFQKLYFKIRKISILLSSKKTRKNARISNKIEKNPRYNLGLSCIL
jgi:hypothetical protein